MSWITASCPKNVDIAYESSKCTNSLIGSNFESSQFSWRKIDPCRTNILDNRKTYRIKWHLMANFKVFYIRLKQNIKILLCMKYN